MNPTDLRSCRSLSSFLLAGKTPHQAVRNCLEPLNVAVSCVTRDVLVASGSDLNKIESLILNKGLPSKLKSNPYLFLTAAMLYSVTKSEGERGPWKVSTAAYRYGIHDSQQVEILSYHWHPQTTRQDPHLHLGSGSKVMNFLRRTHLPTGRVSLEEVLRFLIEELKVKPLRQDWNEMLKSTQSQYEQFRSWPK